MRTFLFFIVLQLIVFSSESGSFPANLYRNYIRGSFYAQEGNLKKALKEFERAKRLDPASVHIRLKIATLLIRLGDIDKAEKELKEAKKIDSDSLDASLALIFLYSYTQRDKELEKEYEEFLKKAHRIKPQDIKISNYLAQFYFYKNRIQEAIKIYEAILKNNPQYVEGFFWLGYLYEEAGERKRAIEVWRKGLEIDSSHAPMLNSLGYIYAEEGINLDEAEEMIKKALEQEANNGAYLDSLGWVYFKKKDYQKAEKYLKKAIEVVKDPVIYDHLGELYIKLNKIDEAISYYREGLSFFSDNENLRKKLDQLLKDKSRE